LRILTSRKKNNKKKNKRFKEIQKVKNAFFTKGFGFAGFMKESIQVFT